MEQLKWRSLVSQVTAFRRAAQEKHTCWAIFHYVCIFKASGGLVLTTCSLGEKKNNFGAFDHFCGISTPIVAISGFYLNAESRRNAKIPLCQYDQALTHH